MSERVMGATLNSDIARRERMLRAVALGSRSPSPPISPHAVSSPAARSRFVSSGTLRRSRSPLSVNVGPLVAGAGSMLVLHAASAPRLPGSRARTARSVSPSLGKLVLGGAVWAKPAAAASFVLGEIRRSGCVLGSPGASRSLGLGLREQNAFGLARALRDQEPRRPGDGRKRRLGEGWRG